MTKETESPSAGASGTSRSSECKPRARCYYRHDIENAHFYQVADYNYICEDHLAAHIRRMGSAEAVWIAFAPPRCDHASLLIPGNSPTVCPNCKEWIKNDGTILTRESILLGREA